MIRHKYAAITKGTRVVSHRCIECNHKKGTDEKNNKCQQEQERVAKNFRRPKF